MKATGFTHLNSVGITECKTIYNHWRKTVKLEIDGGLLHNHKICKLELKLYLSSQMQLLTLFYFGFFFVIKVHYIILLSICKFLFISLGGIFCGNLNILNTFVAYFVHKCYKYFWCMVYFVYNSWCVAYFMSILQL